MGRVNINFSEPSPSTSSSSSFSEDEIVNRNAAKEFLKKVEKSLLPGMKISLRDTHVEFCYKPPENFYGCTKCTTASFREPKNRFPGLMATCMGHYHNLAKETNAKAKGFDSPIEYTEEPLF